MGCAACATHARYDGDTVVGRVGAHDVQQFVVDRDERAVADLARRQRQRQFVVGGGNVGAEHVVLRRVGAEKPGVQAAVDGRANRQVAHANSSFGSCSNVTFSSASAGASASSAAAYFTNAASS